MTESKKALMQPLPRPMKTALLATSACVAATGALAQQQSSGPGAPLTMHNDYFGYALAVGPRATYTDNISLASGLPGDPRDDEFAIGVNTDGSAIYTTNRFTSLISGSLDVSYLTDQAEVVANQDVGAAGTATIADNWIYLDIAGSSRRQLAGDNARYSQNVNAGRSQRVNVHNIAASPYVNHRFANGSAAELRYRFSQVFVGDANNNFGNSLGLNFNKDSRTQEVLASYDTGNAYDRLQVGVTAYGNKTSEYGSSVVQDFDYKQGSISGDFQYALSSKFAVTGVIGYDDVSTTAPSNFISADTLSGVNWRAGFRAQPGRKTDIALQYGERYGDGYVNANIRYDVSGRITFTANASRTVQTRAQAVASQFEATQREILDFADRLRQGGTGDAAQVVGTLSRVARTRIDAQTIGLGVANRANAGLSGVFGRTTLGLTANYSDTDFGFRQVEMYGAGLSARRDVSRRTSAYGNLFVRHVDSTFDPTQCLSSPSSFGLDPTVPGFDPVVACGQLAGFNGVTTTAVVRIGASHKIYKNVSAYGEYSHTERFSQTPGLEYGENAVTAGLQMEF